MSYRPNRVLSGSITGAIVLIGLVMSFLFGGFNLVIFFLSLAVAIFIGGLFSGNPRQLYGSIIGAIWMLMLALFFLTHIWLWFLVGAAISLFLGALKGPIISSLMGMSFFQTRNQPQQPYYQPPYSPQQPYYQPSQQPPYQQGYSGSTPQETYEEGGKQYQYPTQSSSDYEQPQTNYPQQLPPQQ